jgi:hypothetical protein
MRVSLLQTIMDKIIVHWLDLPDQSEARFVVLCQGRVLQPDAVSWPSFTMAVESCATFFRNRGIPPDGSHVRVIGPYILDSERGWMEVYPLTIQRE